MPLKALPHPSRFAFALSCVWLLSPIVTHVADEAGQDRAGSDYRIVGGCARLCGKTQEPDQPEQSSGLAFQLRSEVPSHMQPDQNETVFVSFMVAENGTVEAARVLSSTDNKFNQAAVDAVLTGR